MSDRFYLGIDVGTGSVRAGLFDENGARRGLGVSPIRTWKPEEDFVEQSSEDIWRASGVAVRAALSEAAISPDRIRGIGFDGTCSLVLLDQNDRPVTVSPSGDDHQNVIVWMDHRALREAERINATHHSVLRYVGGVISPEMQTPKLLWLRENLRASFDRAARFFDLPDYMTYRATGIDVRSLCTTVCKWTYLGKEQKWDHDYFNRIGLGDIGFDRIGQTVRPMGERIGGLTREAARELGLTEGTPVGVSIIDAHAGGIGLLGAELDGIAPTRETLEERLALIGGTSSCHMAVSREPKFLNGIWGPYYSAMIPDLWLTEGGQSATGALIDHVVSTHVRGKEVEAEARKEGIHPHAILNRELERVAAQEGDAASAFPARLTRELHVLPDHHGNRSPRADPTLRGMVSGLKLTDSLESLALLYLATIQAVAHGTKHIIDTMNVNSDSRSGGPSRGMTTTTTERRRREGQENGGGYRIHTLLGCGGDLKNPVFVREHADITGTRLVLPKEPEAVLLGSAILGAVASGDCPSVLDAMARMNHADRVVEPARGSVADYHRHKHAVFLRMHDDQLAYREIMALTG